MTTVETDDRYWDCECMGRFIHSKKQDTCPVCGANRDEQPDSRVVEVERYRNLGVLDTA